MSSTTLTVSFTFCAVMLYVGAQATTTTTQIVYADNRRVVEQIKTDGGTIQECFVYDKRFYTQTDARPIKWLDSAPLDELVKSCHDFQVDHKVILQKYLRHRQKRGFFIYPGTKWCGAGNISSHQNDLGYYMQTDMCCRDHDHCNVTISRWTFKYGLMNWSPFTRCHCRCDTKLYQCLKNATEEAAESVGSIYFNYLGSKCLTRAHPTICARKGWFWTCKKWVPDLTQPKKWMFVNDEQFK